MVTIFFSGCSSGGGDSGFVANPGGGGGGGGQSGQTSTLVVTQSLLERAVPSDVTNLRFTGRDASSTTVFGPRVEAKAARYEFIVPSEMKSLVIEYLVDGVAVGVANIQVALVPGGTLVVSEPDFVDTMATLQTIELSPASETLAAGTEISLVATGLFSDGSRENLTNEVSWSSSAPGVASVASGVVTGQSEGSVTITATLATKSAVANLTVTDAVLEELQVTPANSSLAKGTNLEMTATGIFSDGSRQDLTESVQWSSLNSDVATVSNTAGQRGLVQGVVSGSSTIRAVHQSSGVVGQTALFVSTAELESIEVTAADLTIAAGTGVQFVATGRFSDNSSQDITSSVSWMSSNPGVATISNAAGSRGFADSVGITGTTTITATLGEVDGQAELSVNAATLDSITVSAPSSALIDGFSQQYTAMGHYSDGNDVDLTTQATWSSSDDGIVQVSNALATRGLATAQAPGTASITATFQMIPGSASVTVVAATLQSIAVSADESSIADGTTLQYTAMGTFSNGDTANLTSQVTWTSSTPATASVSNGPGDEGLVEALAPGSTSITAELNGVTSPGVALTVTTATLSSIEVTADSYSVPDGLSQQFTATGRFSDNSTQDLTTTVAWTTGDLTVASASNADGSRGEVTGESPGGTTVIATSDTVSGQANFSVSAATLSSIAVTAAETSIANGTKLQYTATGTFSDTSTMDITSAVTWDSSTPATATISNAAGSYGLAEAEATGTTSITAALDGVTSPGVTLTVTAATLSSIEVTADSYSVPDGLSQQFTATGRFSDNSTQDLTTTVAWTTGDGTVASASNADGSRGEVTGESPGATAVIATSGMVSGQASFSVSAATLESIAVEAGLSSIANGTELQYTATGTFSDMTTMDITSAVTWNSSTPTTATISNLAGSNGLAEAVGTGTTSITATLQGVTSPGVTLTVTAATLSRIEVSANSQVIADGTTMGFTATGIFSDGSTQPLTNTVTWTSDDDAIATVSNAMGVEGVAVAIAPGTTNIVATDVPSGISGSRQLSVSAATLSTIIVAPASPPAIPIGLVRPFTATGTFSDGSTQELTTAVTWSSDAPTIVSISNAPGARGQAKGVAVGSTTVRASLGGFSGNTSVSASAATLQSIAVTPLDPVIPIGTTVDFAALGTYSDGSTATITTSVNWSSSAGGVATILTSGVNEGRATGVAAGTTTIQAVDPVTGVTDSEVLTVSGAQLTSITISPLSASVGSTVTQQYFATGNYSNGSTADLTSQVLWASSNPSVAGISNTPGTKGIATPATPSGTSNITASLGGLTSAPGTLTVVAFPLALTIQTSVAHLSGVPGTSANNSVNLSETRGSRTISADGSLMVFASQASNLPGANGSQQIYMRNVSTGTTELISVNPAGNTAGGSSSHSPGLTPDGNFVVFYSYATNLVGADPNGFLPDIYVRDRSVNPNVTYRISGGNDYSINPAISDNGRYVAFMYGGTDVPGVTDTNARYDIFCHDRLALPAPTTELVSATAASATVAGNGYCENPNVSNTGVVVFLSVATNLSSITDNSTYGDIFRRDTVTDSTLLVTVDSLGTGPGNSSSYDPFISADGNSVLFASYANNLGAGFGNGSVYLKNFAPSTPTLEVVSLTSTEGIISGCDSPSMSTDGRFVAFTSSSSSVVPNDTNQVTDIFVRDRTATETRRVNLDNMGNQTGAGSSNYRPSISGNGGFVHYLSNSPNLKIDNSNLFQQSFRSVVPPMP